MKFSVHTVVRNEDCWIWYAIQSILPFAEKILINVNGSEDNTIKAIKSIESPKIFLEITGVQNPKGIVEIRKRQLKATQTDWFLILDGDEVWPSREFLKLINAVQNAPQNIVGLINRTRNCIGDVFHYLPDEAGGYKLAKQKGNLNMRLIRKTEDLGITGEYPLESYVNKYGSLNNQDDNLLFADCWYLHTTYLKRSSLGGKTSGSLGKPKVWEKGIEMTKEELPEVFFKERPEFIPDPFKKRGFIFETVARVNDPLIKLARAFR